MFNGKRKIAVIIACLSALLLGGAAYLLFGGKPARSVYLEAEAKNYEKYSRHLKQVYSEFLEAQKPYLESRHKSRLELTGSVTAANPDSYGLANAKGIIEALGKAKLVIDTRNDPAARQSLSTVSLLIEKTPLLNADIYTKDRAMGVTVPLLTPDRYFLASLDRLDEVYNRFGIPFRPKRPVGGDDLARALKFDPGELDNISREYGPLISGLIGKDSVKYGKKLTLTVGGRQVKARELVVTLDGAASAALLKKLSEKAFGDGALMGLTIGNYAALMGLAGDTGLPQLEQFMKDSGRLQLNEALISLMDRINPAADTKALKQKLKALGTEAACPDGISMTLVVDASGNILDRKLKFDIVPGEAAAAGSTPSAGNNGVKWAVELHTGANDVKNENFDNAFISLELTKTSPGGETTGEAYAVNTALGAAGQKAGRKGTITAGYQRKQQGEAVFAVDGRFELDQAVDEATLKKNSSIKYDITIKGGSSGTADRLSGEIVSTESENKKQKSRNLNTSIALQLDLKSFEMEPASIKVGIAREDRFDIPEFKLPQVNAARGIDLNTASDEQLARAGDEIKASFGSFYLGNKSLFDTVMESK